MRTRKIEATRVEAPEPALRPRERRHQRTREDILRAARKIVLTGGMEALSLRAVAAEASFSPAALYEYFDGREAIVQALAAETMGRLTQHLATAAGSSPAKRLVAMGMAYVDFALAHPDDFLLAFTRFESRRQSESEAVPGESPYRLLADAVGAAIEAGEIDKARGASVDSLAYAVWAHAHGMAMLRLTHLRGFDADFTSADRRGLTALVLGLGAQKRA